MVRMLPVRLWLLSDQARVLVLVWDGDPRQPARADPTMDDEAGRGLLLVESLSTRWGWHGAGELGGKVVWAAVRAELQPMQHSAVSDKRWNPPDAGAGRS
jgi:hypothetical protein